MKKERELRDSRTGGFVEQIERVADGVRADDEMRLLEPTSLPKEIRGFKRRGPANSAILSRIAFEAFKARMWAEGVDLTDEEAMNIFRGYCDGQKNASMIIAE